MDTNELQDRLQRFISSLEQSGSAVTSGARDKASDLASDVQSLISHSHTTLGDKYYMFSAHIGDISNKIYDAVSENDLYVIMNALFGMLNAIIRELFSRGVD